MKWFIHRSLRLQSMESSCGSFTAEQVVLASLSSDFGYMFINPALNSLIPAGLLTDLTLQIKDLTDGIVCIGKQARTQHIHLVFIRQKLKLFAIQRGFEIGDF